MSGGLFDLDSVPTQPHGPTDPFLRTIRTAAIDAETAKVRHDARDTSRAAAANILGRSGSVRRRVFDLLATHPNGLTDEEITEQLRLNPSTARPRRVELVDAGLVADSGQRRRVSSGLLATVWVLSTVGREVAA